MKMRTILTLIFASIVFNSCQSQSTDLCLKLEKGKEYKQITSSKATVIQQFNGQEINMTMTITGTMTFLVKDITESNYNIDTKFERLGMSMEMPQGTIEFSSENNDANDIFSTVLGAMTNKTFEVKMNKTGKITEVNNVEALWETAINQFEQLTEMQKEQLKAQIMKAYGGEAVKGNIEMVTAIYPDKPVNKGDKWTINTKLESGMSAEMTTDYEFTDLTSDYALINGNSTIKTADKDAYIESNGMPMKYDLTGSMISEIKVDKNTGWIVEAKIKQEIKGDAYIKENPQVPNGMKVPITMINEMVIHN